MKKNIILTGFMGSGKSTVGKILSKKLNFNFVDTDRIIEEKENLKISEIFKIFGEKYFRNLENSILNEIKSLKKTVIATGGGFPVYIKKPNILKSIGVIFYLHADCKILFKRVKFSKHRPLISKFFYLYKKRLLYYKNLSDYEIDTSFLKPDNVSLIIQEIYENCCR